MCANRHLRVCLLVEYSGRHCVGTHRQSRPLGTAPFACNRGSHLRDVQRCTKNRRRNSASLRRMLHVATAKQTCNCCSKGSAMPDALWTRPYEGPMRPVSHSSASLQRTVKVQMQTSHVAIWMRCTSPACCVRACCRLHAVCTPCLLVAVCVVAVKRCML
jgi:hypothetical protein